MNPDYEPGHAPTDTDENNAMLYASMNQKHAICASDPVNYVWKADAVVGYPCPEGLTCYSGRCEFTKQGCQNYSVLPYFDCKRKSVPCNFGNGDETCQMCDWDIEPSKLSGIPCPTINSPSLTDDDKAALGNQAMFCRPGDLKYSTNENPDPKAPKDLCRPSQAEACPGLNQTFTPYTIDGNKISCQCDDDCSTNGAGGQCLMDSTNGGPPQPLPSGSTCADKPPSPAYCYPPTGANGTYTEWREGFTVFNGAPQEDACVQTFASAKQWCEMPWTHTTVPNAAGTAADPPCWKTQYKQPFYYRQEDGKCYVTKSYCENNVGEGGFAGSFGDAHDYWVVSTCTTPQGNSNEIQKGYDCCTSLGQSIADFFFGKTIPAEIENIAQYASNTFSGNSPATYCGEDGVSLASTGGNFTSTPTPTPSVRDTVAPLISFLSDERLKENIELVEENACGLGINLYKYTWNSVAKRVYKKPHGVMTGLLIKELERVFPQNIRTSPYGHKVFAHVPDLMPQLPDFRTVVYINVMLYLLGSSDVETA